MHVTIDSAEALEKVLPVIAALYGVELVVAPKNVLSRKSNMAAPKAESGGSGRTRKAAAGSASGPARGRARRRTAKLDASTIRAWARANGFAVKDVGRVPAALVSAYVAAGQPAA